MPDLATERAHLAQAERAITEGEARLLRQADLVARLRAQGLGTGQAQALLRNFRQTLQEWKTTRTQIRRMIVDAQR